MTRKNDTENLLADLLAKLVETLGEKLATGDYTAADLNVIRQLLKDNEITARNDEDSDFYDAILDNLPDDWDEVSQ